MQLSWSDRVWRAARHIFRPDLFLSAVCAMTLAACNLDDHATALNGGPRGATVAFESIDGPPPGQFNELVQALNSEAQTRRLAVVSRESPSAYRVRGYLAASVTKRQATISWVWDVFDNNGRRALRIAGAETAKGSHRGAWATADGAMLQRIARTSMDQLATFLTSPEVAPGTPDAAPRLALAMTQESSPEAAGIFRISHPNLDPLPAGLPPDTPAVAARDAPAKLAASR